MSYFPTPFNFDKVMVFLGLTNGSLPYTYSYPSLPVDAASYAAITWLDQRAQPSWSYLTLGGAGWTAYDNWYQSNVSPVCSAHEAVIDAIASAMPAAQVNADWNASSGIAAVLNKPVARSQSVVTRALNTAFQVSSTRDTLSVYAISISSVLSLSGGQTGAAQLQICPTQTGTYVPLNQISNGNTGSLTVGLNTTQALIQTLVGVIPAGYWAKIVTSGTATIAYSSGQEMLF
jgi:hypothetical protein